MQGAEGLSAADGCVDGNLTAESLSRALGIQGEGQGVRPTASPKAKDFFIELPRRDTSRRGRKVPYGPKPWDGTRQSASDKAVPRDRMAQ